MVAVHPTRSQEGGSARRRGRLLNYDEVSRGSGRIVDLRERRLSRVQIRQPARVADEQIEVGLPATPPAPARVPLIGYEKREVVIDLEAVKIPVISESEASPPSSPDRRRESMTAGP